MKTLFFFFCLFISQTFISDVQEYDILFVSQVDCIAEIKVFDVTTDTVLIDKTTIRPGNQKILKGTCSAKRLIVEMESTGNLDCGCVDSEKSNESFKPLKDDNPFKRRIDVSAFSEVRIIKLPCEYL